MKEIKAVIQSHMLMKVLDSLQAIENIPGVIVSEVRAFGRGSAEPAKHKITEDFIDYATKCKLEMFVRDELADEVVDVIARNAHTGLPGDGVILVSPVDQVVRIRTDERTP